MDEWEQITHFLAEFSLIKVDICARKSQKHSLFKVIILHIYLMLQYCQTEFHTLKLP